MTWHVALRQTRPICPSGGDATPLVLVSRNKPLLRFRLVGSVGKRIPRSFYQIQLSPHGFLDQRVCLFEFGVVQQTEPKYSILHPR